MGIATPQDQAFAQKAQEVFSYTVLPTLEDPVNRVKSWGTLANPYATDEEKRKARDYVAPLPINPDGTLNEEGLARAGGAIMGISTFHGSPKGGIKKLSNEFVGSGEGAQAYGWGSYTAEGKGTGEWYRDKLGGWYEYYLDGKKVDLSSMPAEQSIAISTLTDPLVARAAGISNTQSKLPSIGDIQKIADVLKSDEGTKAAGKWLSNNAQRLDVRSKGHLYQVELLPHQDEYLQWDKPLNQQVKNVQYKLREAGITSYPDAMEKELLESVKESDRATIVKMLDAPYKSLTDGTYDKEWRQLTKNNPNANLNLIHDIRDWHESKSGSDLYQELTNSKGSDRAASEYLESLGIKGIKYLDGTSRGKGEGRYNYVTFNPEAESIITHENDVRIPNAVEEAYAKVRDPESKALLEQKYPELRTTPVSVQQMYNKTTDPARRALLEKKYPELKIEARENGGPMQAGKPYIVGENGPEIVVPKENGYVIPNNNLRPNGTPKGYGYFGKIPMLNDPNKSMTEITIGLDELGDIPLVVPTLTAEEIDYLRRGNKPTKEMVNKAADHAIMRRKQGLSPYYD